MTTAWPEGVIARYLTVAGATVDISVNHTAGGTMTVDASCTGELCRWNGRDFVTGQLRSDTPEETEAKVDKALRPVQRLAQAHAETCRAMLLPA